MTTRDEILGMAREAGFVVSDLGVGFPMGERLTIADLCENLVRLAQAAAYERAAKVCETRSSAEKIRSEGVLSDGEIDAIVGANELCADAIRSLKEQM